jgi:hypothetical protein
MSANPYLFTIGGRANPAPGLAGPETTPAATGPVVSGAPAPTGLSGDLTDLAAAAADALPGFKGPAIHRVLKMVGLVPADKREAFDAVYAQHKPAIDSYFRHISARELAVAVDGNPGIVKAENAGSLILGLIAGIGGAALLTKFKTK